MNVEFMGLTYRQKKKLSLVIVCLVSAFIASLCAASITESDDFTYRRITAGAKIFRALQSIRLMARSTSTHRVIFPLKIFRALRVISSPAVRKHLIQWPIVTSDYFGMGLVWVWVTTKSMAFTLRRRNW